MQVEGRDHKSGELTWTGTRAGLLFGSTAQLRAIAEVFGNADSRESFVDDFVEAWVKVMELDWFDIA